MKWYVAAPVLLALSCGTGEVQTVPGQGVIPCTSSSDGHLFPTSELQEREGWYGELLRAEGEPALCDRAGHATAAYRFIWLRSFAPAVFVRVEWAAEAGRLIAVGAGDRFDTATTPKRVERFVTQSEWDRIQQLEGQVQFWSDEQLDTDRHAAGLDGAYWIIEGIRDGRYRAIERWTPSDSLRPFGLYLLDLAGLRPLNADEIY